MNNKPHVLIIGHNVFDHRTALGKTLIGFFAGWDKNCLAELFFHSEVPTCKVCINYFRVTDSDVLHNVFAKRKSDGTIFFETDIDESRTSPRTDSGIKRRIYSFGRKRTPFIYLARNFIWKKSHWFSSKLKTWVSNFSPDIIFFAAGDYAFAYDITYTISKEFNIPVLIYCSDDYFLNKLNSYSPLGAIAYKSLMKSVNRCASQASAMITICDKMADAYKDLFSLPIFPIYTAYSDGVYSNIQKCKTIVYLGNLGYDRYESLIDVGKALERINKETGQKYVLEVYSSENREKILKKISEQGCIVFRGYINEKEVKRVISSSLLVLHTESFKEKNIRKVRYSISTKIADLLSSGTCIFAYGPLGIASIDYLKNTHSALIATNFEELETCLKQAILDSELRKSVLINAKIVSSKNHNPSIVSEKIKNIVENIKAL